MLVEEVLRLCATGEGAQNNLLDATPVASDCVARLKRQRVCSGCESVSEAGSASVQTVATPRCDATSPPVQPSPPGVPWAASFLLDFVRQCLENLCTMHASCRAIQQKTRAAEMACAIFRRSYLSRDGHAQSLLVRERTLAGALLAASLWLAIKFEANRTTTPDANLMSRISGIPAGFLRQQEREILADLDWDLMSAAREAGAVAAPDYSDEVCLDQQRQLAHLAAPALPPPALPPPACAASQTASAPAPIVSRLPGGSAVQIAALLASQQHAHLPQHLKQQPTGQQLCSNLLAAPVEAEAGFLAAEDHDMPACSSTLPTSSLAVLGW